MPAKRSAKAAPKRKAAPRKTTKTNRNTRKKATFKAPAKPYDPDVRLKIT